MLVVVDASAREVEEEPMEAREEVEETQVVWEAPPCPRWSDRIAFSSVDRVVQVIEGSPGAYKLMDGPVEALCTFTSIRLFLV